MEEQRPSAQENRQIDLNCDMGEGLGPRSTGADDEILPWVSSISIACGFHAGDPGTMRRTARKAIEHSVAIGAHPGLPDLVGFGRRRMEVSPEEVFEMVIYQTGALAGIVRGEGGELHHVKPHGALYHMAAFDHAIAAAVVRAIAAFDRQLCLYAPPASALAEAARGEGVRVAIEVLADRRYRSDGTLVPRREPAAVIEDPLEAARIAAELVTQKRVRSIDGDVLWLDAQTIGIHGDNAPAPLIARSVRMALEAVGVVVRSQSVRRRSPGDAD